MPRPKKTLRQRKLEGNPSKRPLPAPVQPPPGVPSPPKWLKGAGLAEWKRVTPILDSIGALSALDRAPLADYCLCVARVQEIEQQISKDGLIIEGRNRSTTAAGQRIRVKHPLWTVLMQYRKSLQAYAGLFGFAAGPRGRLNLPEPDQDDDPDGLLD